MVSMLLVLCVAAVAVVSAVALTEASQATISTKAPPGTPHTIFGYTYDIDGVTPLVSCDVIITNLNTSEQIVTTSDSVEGIYSVDLSLLTLGWSYNDSLNVTAQKGAFSGWNVSLVTENPSEYDQIDVWVKEPLILIPEFPMVILPVGGIIALVAVLGLMRRHEEH